MNEPQEQLPVNTDLDHGKEGHKFPAVLIVGWLIFIVGVVSYISLNIGQSWEKW